jgi:hypothetical protein
LILNVDHHKVSDISDDEDFTLNATETEAIFSPAISPQQRAKREQPTGNSKYCI